MTTYTFSYYSPTKTPVLKRRPWWNLFGRDTIVTEETLGRRVIADIPQDEADLILAASENYWNTAFGRIFVRMLGKVSMVQLESDPQATSYIPTTGARRVTNRLSSEPFNNNTWRTE